MSDVNTSFYNSQPPMAGAAQLMQLMQGIRQQQMFGLQMAGRQAAGQAFIGAGDPSDPQFSSNFVKNIQDTGNPMAASFAPEMMQQARATALSQQQIMGAKFDNAMKTVAYLPTVIGPELGNPNLTQADIINKLGSEITNPESPLAGRNDIFKQTVQELSKIPDTPQTNQNYIMQHYNNSKGAVDNLAAMMPQPVWTDFGSYVAPVDHNVTRPWTTGTVIGPQISKNLTPAEAADPFSWKDPTGVLHTGTKGQAIAGSLGVGSTPGYTPGVPTGAAPSTTPGAVPPVVTPSTPDLSPQPNTSGAAGPTPLLDDRIKRSGEMATEYRTNAANAQNTLAYLEEAKTLLPHIGVGGLSETRTEAARIAQGLGASPDLVGKIQGGQMDDSLGDAQAFSKLMVPLAISSGRQALGGTTGLKNQEEFNTFLKNWPHLETDPGAIDKMTGFMGELAQVANAKNSGWGKWISNPANGPDKVDPSEYEAQFNSTWAQARAAKAKREAQGG